MAFWKYFDLNGRVGSSPRGVVDRSSDPLETKKPIHQDRPKGVSPKDEEEFETSGIRVSNQTDTQSSRLKVGEEQQEKPSSTTPVAMPLWEQILLYAGLVVGVLFSSAVMQWKAGNAANVAFTFTGVALSIVIAFILLPVVYEKLSVNARSPLLVRFGLAMQHGVFWQVLLGAIGKVFGG